MRVRVVGDCPCARSLRGDLELAGFHVTEWFPRYTVFIEEFALGASDVVLVDSIDGKIDQAIVKHLRSLTPKHLRIQTEGGIQSEHEIRIVCSPDETERHAVETGVLRGLLEIRGRSA